MTDVNEGDVVRESDWECPRAWVKDFGQAAELYRTREC